MQGYSLVKWSWFRLPDAIITDGLIIPGEEREPYYPGEDTIKLLNAVREIKDDKSALEFVKNWGLLGIHFGNLAEAIRQEQEIIGASKFAFATRGEHEYDSIEKDISKVFYPEGDGEGLCLMSKGDSLLETVNFAQWVRYISEVQQLIALYKKDPCAASYDTKNWFSNHPDKKWREPDGRLLHFERIKYAKYHGPKYDESDFYKSILKYFLDDARSFYFGVASRGIYVELSREGDPLFQFDGLFRLIAYVLLARGGVIPKKCEDPNCNEVFFPGKADQIYCPPPSGKKRSLCGMRHSKKITRGIIKEYRSGKTIEEISKIYGGYRDVEQTKKIIENSLKKKAAQ